LLIQIANKNKNVWLQAGFKWSVWMNAGYEIHFSSVSWFSSYLPSLDNCFHEHDWKVKSLGATKLKKKLSALLTSVGYLNPPWLGRLNHIIGLDALSCHGLLCLIMHVND
jgi:hypothetical protein